MKEKLLNLIEPESEDVFQELTDFIEDVVLFCDDHGVVIKKSIGARNFWGFEVTNKPLWSLLGVSVGNINKFLSKYPAGRTCRITLKDKGPCNLWIMPIPQLLAPNGGFVATLTPLTELYEPYEEYLQDNIAARKDSFKLFAALFDAAPDATILVDESFDILSANPKAVRVFALDQLEESSISFLDIISKPLRQIASLGIDRLRSGKTWCAELVAQGVSGEEVPVAIRAKRVRLSDQLLFQIILKDLSLRTELEENLKDREEELESMDNTLRTVIRTIEEEKQEYRDEVLGQVKQYVLPTIDKIAEVPSQDLRKSYSGILKSRIEGIVESGSEVSDELLSLSARQLEICQLICVGMKGKEIAELLNISFETLQSHRKNIRKKLKLCGTKISLAAYLANRTDLENE
ncbi:PAS domain S-box protein [Halodesulfovibrio marinisediminis]|uniref:PAS domain S-box-containing protein n=1 Tax=Halodesulfovibrio marinisediminis DSM 17456 TaxID=1121457 RepID=A0A1N6GPZ6_9BACT|nr:PAS domain S-box protein [Halodesulfovibrio marinisediminis]SIO09599.1 PAS domain S-box-containing protein [Halodesulfovibrio marinisediminis DSM 17456]